MNKKFIFSGLFLLLFAGLIVLLKNYDVAQIGPSDTYIGFSAINQNLHKFFGVNMLFYYITDFLGYFSICSGSIFALLGIYQWYKRKNIWKVDPEIIGLGVLYSIMALLYVLFEFVIINYRPIIMAGEAEVEASFPSSHTMLTVVIFISIILISNKYIKNISLRKTVKIACGIFTAVAVIGRLICGVHWFTDIIGGVLLSLFQLFAFSGYLDTIDKN